MQATARRSPVVSSTFPARRRLIRIVMTRGVVPAVESHADVVLIAAAHHTLQSLVEFMWIVAADALHPHLAAVFADLPGLGDELKFLPALGARLYGINVLPKVKSAGHNNKNAGTL